MLERFWVCMLVDAVKSSFFGFVVSSRSFLGLGFRGSGFVPSWVLERIWVCMFVGAVDSWFFEFVVSDRGCA